MWRKRTYSIDGRVLENADGRYTLRMTSEDAGEWPDELTVLSWLKTMFGVEMAIMGAAEKTHARQRIYRVERL